MWISGRGAFHPEGRGKSKCKGPVACAYLELKAAARSGWLSRVSGGTERGLQGGWEGPRAGEPCPLEDLTCTAYAIRGAIEQRIHVT